MQNNNAKFKEDFKKRLYSFVLKLINLIDKLPKDSVSRIIGDQLLRSGTSILGNYIEAARANESKLWMALLRDSGRANPANN